MREILKMAGFIALILAIFFAASVAVSFFIASYYASSIGPDPEVMMELVDDLLQQYIVHITAVSEVLALALFWLTFRLLGGSLLRQCRFRPRPGRDLWMAIGLGVGLSLMLSALLNLFDAHRLFPEHADLIQTVVDKPSLPVAFIAVGLFGPLFEEVMYRGIIFNRIRDTFSLPVAVLLHAVIFGAIHGNVLQGTYAFVCSIPIALTYVWSGSLWVPVSIHAGWNTTSVLMSRLPGSAPGVGVELIMGLLGGVAFIQGIMYFRRRAPVSGDAVAKDG